MLETFNQTTKYYLVKSFNANGFWIIYYDSQNRPVGYWLGSSHEFIWDDIITRSFKPMISSIPLYQFSNMEILNLTYRLIREIRIKLLYSRLMAKNTKCSDDVLYVKSLIQGVKKQVEIFKIFLTSSENVLSSRSSILAECEDWRDLAQFG